MFCENEMDMHDELWNTNFKDSAWVVLLYFHLKLTFHNIKINCKIHANNFKFQIAKTKKKKKKNKKKKQPTKQKKHYKLIDSPQRKGKALYFSAHNRTVFLLFKQDAFIF